MVSCCSEACSETKQRVRRVRTNIGPQKYKTKGPVIPNFASPNLASPNLASAYS